MVYRINIVTFDVTYRDDVIAYLNSVREEMKAIDGLQSVRIVETEGGRAFGLAEYSSADKAAAAAPFVQRIMGGMAGFMTAPPTSSMGTVIWSV